MRRKILVFICLVLLIYPASSMAHLSQNYIFTKSSANPSMLTTATEIGAGAVGSFVGFTVFGGCTVILILGTAEPENIGELLGETIIAAVLGGVVGLGGSIIGSATGVYIVGNLGGVSGPLWAPLIGSALGTIPGVALAALAQDNTALAFTSLALGQSLGATVLFNWMGRSKTGYRYGALLNVDNSEFRLGFPTIYPRLDFINQDNLSYGVGCQILNYRF
jgi:hypothetical protein